MKPIQIIAPHRTIASKAKTIAERYSDVEVKFGLLDQAVNIAYESEKSGVEVLISRGGTAELLEKKITSLPVIGLPVSPYDLLNAIHRAKEYGKNIIVIGFGSIIRGVEQLAPILDVNIVANLIENKLDADNIINSYLKSGKKIDVLLGGAVAEDLARTYGIPTILLETDAITIENSIKEARKLIKIRNQERQKAEKFKAILHYINQGVVAVDKQCKITTFNSAASKITGIDQKGTLEKNISEVIANSNLKQVIRSNKPKLGQLQNIGGIMTLINKVPIVVKGETVGAVATFEDVSIIQEYERKIRYKLLNKGHIAKYTFSDILGNSKAIVKTKKLAKKYASVDSTVLIIGKSGTGKEMFAQSIHNTSSRKNGPFVAVNCSAIPETLLESELFGYEEGAFTGARKKGKSGLFTVAHTGTIFLDEIGEISTNLQSRLLRVIQEKEVMPLGSEKVIHIDVRIIAASNKNLIEEVKEGNFRSDLYYRLNILNLRISDLKERKGDIRLLAEHFITIYSQKLNKKLKLSKNALLILENNGWSGNIRELENAIERICVICDKEITESLVRELIFDSDLPYKKTDPSIMNVKLKHIIKTLDECQGNRTVAAKMLGISRASLWRALKAVNT